MILLWEWKKRIKGYLEECKYKSKKIRMPKSINTELELGSKLECETQLESKPALQSNTE